jgi:hypothetical protein
MKCLLAFGPEFFVLPVAVHNIKITIHRTTVFLVDMYVKLGHSHE